tara:strand:- start:77 stop:808 length:732 start_codon:yes stop_codon:yes gene_type:complete
MNTDFLIVIPARYSSSRFPGKPLAMINGKSMLERVWDKCIKVTSKKNIIIATDDERIEEHCKQKQLNYIRTSSHCLTGTDRIAEVAMQIKADFYINVQGDEPLIEPSDINLILNRYMESPGKCYCGMSKITNEEDFYNPNIPKVVVSSNNQLLYISRAAIPTTKKLDMIEAKKQVCIYAFTKDSLNEYGVNSKKEENESVEDIEILRLIERGYEVEMVEVSDSSIAVDTPEDLKRVEDYLDDL